MPTGDPVQRVSASQEAQSSDGRSGAQSPSVSRPAGQPRTITPKSAAITARNNYVSPYRQTPPSRSLSSPVVRANAGNANSPNFKDIVTRFNTKSDEKIPNPTNRIPATAAAAGSLKSKKPQTWKANGLEARKHDSNSAPKPRASSAAPPPVRSKQPARPSSARDSYSASGTTTTTTTTTNNNNSSTNKNNSSSSRQARARRLSTSSSNSSDRTTANSSRLLPPIQTSFSSKDSAAKGLGYRRSQSALDTHSPSAASMADNESDASDRRILHHRRSRSNIESSSRSPPLPGERIIDKDLLMGFAKDDAISPGTVVPPAVAAAAVTTSTEPPPASSSPPLLHQPKKKTVTVPLTSAHGSRRPPQPSKSPQLSAYISAPLPKTSPPLRSSRGQRLPAAVNSSTHASRQRLQPSTSPKEGNYQRVKSKAVALEDGRQRKEPKKKIPELGTIDFAARRAAIQSAYTKNLKETSEHSTKSSERKAKPSRKEISQGRIDEEDEENEENENEDEDEEGRAEEEGKEKEKEKEKEREKEREEVAGGRKPEIEADRELDQSAHQLVVDKIPTPELPHSGHVDVGDDVIVEDQLEDEVKGRSRAEEAGGGAESTVWESTGSSSSDDSASAPSFSLPSQQEQKKQKQQQQNIVPKEELDVSDEAKPIEQHATHTPVGETVEEAPPMEESPPRRVKRFSQFFMPEQYPYTTHKHRSSQAEVHQTQPEQQQPSEEKRASVRKPGGGGAGGGGAGAGAEGRAPIAFVVTPESPTGPDLLNQVSDMLRSNSVGWSTDSELSGDSPILQDGRPDRGSGANVGSRGRGRRSTNQREEATRFAPTLASPPSPGRQHEPPPDLLSPMISATTSDNRRTINSIYSEYDDHGEDIVRSYAEAQTPIDSPRPFRSSHRSYGQPDGGDDTEAEYGASRAPEDDSRSFTSCSDALDSARPSSACDNSMAEETEDGWTTSSDFSPDPEDRPSLQLPESPTTPRQPVGSESPLPPTPPPKDVPPPLPQKDRKPHSISPVASSANYPPAPIAKPALESASQRGSALLPEIPPDAEPLGLAIQTLPSHFDLRPGGDRQSSYSSEHYYTKPSTDHGRPSIDSRSSMDQRPSMDQYSINRPSLDQKYSPPSSTSDSRRSSMFAPNGNRYSETTIPSMNTTVPERASSSIHSLEAKDTPEQKMLKKRQHLLKELVDTESAFFRDMTVAEEIYKGSANACQAIKPEDVKVLFANTDSVVQFSKGFLEVLKLAVSSVYVMRRSPKGINSSATSLANSANSDDRLDDVLSDEEKDRKTYVGEAFAEVMYRMERVYGDYCKNHDTALARLLQLETNPGIKIWLEQCQKCAEDLTNAWNLESLLIKPVQRVLKYPLLLTQLLGCTPANHPDYAALEIANKEMTFVAGRINEMKKRKDVVGKIVGRKRGDTNIRHGIGKVLSRNTEKLRQTVGLSPAVKDETFNKLVENYNMHCAQVEVVARDIEIYAADIQSHVDRFIAFTSAFRLFGSSIPTMHTQTEEKWKRFDTAMKEISTTYLHEHKLRVRKHAIDPLEALLKLHESPHLIMTKRNNKAVDFARYLAIKAKGMAVEKTVKDFADEYIALNETLIEELPRLFVLTKRLVDAVLFNFIDLQAQWMNDWASKIKMTFIELDLPMNIDDLVHCFAGDFAYNETLINQLSICNGTLNAMQFPSLNSANSSSLLSPSGSSTTLSLEAFDSNSFRRPKTADDNNLRERAMSLNSQSPTVSNFNFDTSERRHSGGAFPPLSPTGSVLSLAPALLGPSNRIRASSVAVAAQRGSAGSTVPTPTTPQRSYSSNIPESHAAAQSSFFHAERPAARGAYTAAAPPPLTLSSRRAEAPSPSPPLPSAAFSSAMPMDDDRDRETSNPPSRVPSRASSRTQSRTEPERTLTVSANDKAMFIAASLFEFRLDPPRREAGFPYLNYVQGEIFDVIGVKGEIWLARNQDDSTGAIGWIWCKHFTKLPEN